MVTEQSIVAVLGGKKSIGQEIKKPFDIDSLIKKGIPFKATNQVRIKLRLSLPKFVALVKISESGWARARRTNKRLSTVVSDRVYRVARIFSIATQVLEDEDEARKWLSEKQVGLGGNLPLDLMQTEAGAKEVEDLLWRIEYGVIS